MLLLTALNPALVQHLSALPEPDSVRRGMVSVLLPAACPRAQQRVDTPARSPHQGVSPDASAPKTHPALMSLMPGSPVDLEVFNLLVIVALTAGANN